MVSKVIILALLAFAAVSNGQSFPRINGGTPALVGEFPSVVSIQTPALPHCGGVIVNQNHIVTSNQCVRNVTNALYNPFWIIITAGDLNIFQPTFGRFQTRGLQIYSHPQYNPSNRQNDIAVVRVIDPFPLPHNSIDVAFRNVRVLADGTQCRFAGWGANTAVAAVTATQQAINAPILNRVACNAPLVHAGSIAENMICAGSLAAGPSPCVGNLGSGLFCNQEFTGILIFGTACGVANMPGAYLQIRFFNDWINEQFLRNDTTFP